LCYAYEMIGCLSFSLFQSEYGLTEDQVAGELTIMYIYVYIYIQGDAFNLRHSNISKNKHTTKKC